MAFIGQLSPPSRIMQVLHCVGLIVVVPCNIVLGSGGCRQLGLVRAGWRGPHPWEQQQGCQQVRGNRDGDVGDGGDGNGDDGDGDDDDYGDA